jgi:hypothetical protein
MEYFTDTDMGLDIGLVNRAVESAFADHGKRVPPAHPEVDGGYPPPAASSKAEVCVDL